MKPEIVYIITADTTLIEDGTGKASLIGTFNEVLVKDGQPLSTMTIFARIINAKGTKKAKVEILDPEGKTFSSLTLGEGSANPQNDLNLRAIFNTLLFKKPGKYNINIFLDDAQLLSSPHHSFSVSF